MNFFFAVFSLAGISFHVNYKEDIIQTSGQRYPGLKAANEQTGDGRFHEKSKLSAAQNVWNLGGTGEWKVENDRRRRWWGGRSPEAGAAQSLCVRLETGETGCF